jgi:hypothetical protein
LAPSKFIVSRRPPPVISGGGLLANEAVVGKGLRLGGVDHRLDLAVGDRHDILRVGLGLARQGVAPAEEVERHGPLSRAKRCAASARRAISMSVIAAAPLSRAAGRSRPVCRREPRRAQAMRPGAGAVLRTS